MKIGLTCCNDIMTTKALMIIGGIAELSKFEWILGTARTQIPLLGNKLIGYQCFASIHKGYKRQNAKS